MAIPGSQVGNEQEHREHQTVYNKHLRNDSIFGDNASFFFPAIMLRCKRWEEKATWFMADSRHCVNISTTAVDVSTISMSESPALWLNVGITDSAEAFTEDRDECEETCEDNETYM